MSVLDRQALEQSPLADLHAIASELSLDSYRRLRKADLIDAILARQGGGPSERSDAGSDAGEDAGSDAGEDAGDDVGEDGGEDAGLGQDVGEDDPAARPVAVDVDDDADADEERPASRRRRGRRGGRGRGSARAEAAAEEPEDEDVVVPDAEASDGGESGLAETFESESPGAGDDVVEGEVDLLPNGSAFLRVSPPDPSDDDVYISAAQVKRCELVSGDRIAGPRRAPRRSERFASLVRIDTINGQPASEVVEGARYDDLPAAFPNERIRLGSEDPTVKAIEWLTPFGKGSRVSIVGASHAGKTEALRRLAAALAEHEDLQLFVVLAGVRPEEIGEWSESSTPPTAAVSFAASPDAQGHAIELVVDRARRAATRGGDAVVLIDTLDGVQPQAARRATAAARNIVDGGSLTVIATARAAVGGETTVIALDVGMAAAGRFPALDMVASGTLRPELLVGDAGAQAIARARAAAQD
jgi:transcription termination factor Rho